MGTSSITVTALTATPTLRGNKLAATVSATGPAANIPTLMLANVEFYASATNDFTTAAYVGEGNPDFLHAGLIEEQTYYYWSIPRAVNGSKGAMYPVSATAGVACTAIGMSGLAFGLANGKIVASVAGNALTVAIKTAAGNDPSVSDPVYLAFPNSTAAQGNYQIRQITAALSLTISNGSTLGVNTNSKPFRLWFVVFDDGGTLRLGVQMCSDGTAIIIITDGARGSATAEGGAGGADTAIFYAAVTISDKPYRIVGYADWSSGLATIGAWATAPDVVRLVGSGLRAPGQVLYEVSGVFQWTPSATFTALIPWDNSIPQISEGTAILSAPIFTPQSTINIIEVELMINASHSVASLVIMALFKGGAANAIGAAVEYLAAADAVIQLHLKVRVQALSTSLLTFEVRVGAVSAGTTTINGAAGGAKLSASYISTYAFRELAG